MSRYGGHVVLVNRVELGDDRELVYDREDHVWRFRHWCDRSSSSRGRYLVSIALNPAHTVTEASNGVTVHPSILCPDCGTHGWVEASTWRAA